MENINTYTHVPPGFRFHPTDEELVDYYLRRKVNSRRIDLNVIKDVDLYKIEPWDLQEICRMGNEEQSEWFFFSHKDRKYPTGSRTNRATKAGFWKATGRDKAIYSKHVLIGMRKTLVFYKGRAPNGQKSDWIMHEYRLENVANGAPQEEGWVVCKVVSKKKSTTTMRNTQESPSCNWYDNYQVSSMLDLDSCQKELDHHNHHHQQQHQRLVLPDSRIPEDHFIHLPLLDNSKVVHPSNSNALVSYNLGITQQGNYSMQQLLHNDNAPTIFEGDRDQGALDDQATDWRVLDKFVASQFSQEDAPKGNNINNNMNYSSTSSIVSELLNNAPLSHDHSNKEESMLDNASTSTSSSQIEASK